MYQVETSSNLVDWVPLLTTNSVASNVTLTTGMTGGLTSEFYRAVDLGPVSGGLPSAEFTLFWPGTSGTLVPIPLGLTSAGSVGFVVESASGKAVTNQVVNLSASAGQATVDFTNLANGSYTLVADAYPQPNGVGVPFEEARFFFTVTGGAPVTQTFTLADNTITNLILTPPNPIVATAGTLQLNATAFDASNEVVFVASQSGAWTWSSVDTTVATVDYTGKVTGVGPGYATTMIFVTETANPAITTNITVTVSNEIYGLTITNSPVVFVGVGEETNLTATATNANGVKVPLAASAWTWTSSSPTNAVVDQTGLLVGVASGLATISLTVKNVGVIAATTANVTLGGPGNGADGVPPPTNGYIITDLGVLTTPDTTISSAPEGINDKGHIAGTAWDSLDYDYGANSFVPPRAFIWKSSLNDQMTDLGDLGGGQAEATGINDSDQVVGWSIKAVTILNKTQYDHAVLWNNSKIKDLDGDLSSYLDAPVGGNMDIAYAINDQSQMVGDFVHPATTNSPIFDAGGFILTENSQQTNGVQLGGVQIPQAINNAGLAGGFDELSPTTATGAPFLWQAGQITYLNNLPNTGFSYIRCINNLGQAVGLSGPTIETAALQNSHAALWQNGQVTNLDDSGNFSRAWGINDLGTVVGDVWTNSGDLVAGHAVLWAGTNSYDLNAYIPLNSGWVLDAASGINNKGQIIGQGTRTNELGYRSFLLTPNN